MHIFLQAGIASLIFAAPAVAQPTNTVGDGLAAIAAARAAESGNPAGPVPVSDPGTWVRSEDYPAWAAANRVSGTVGLVIDVDAEGGVTGCHIRESSGVAAFDTVACEKITERARFRPARDEHGNPVAGQWRNRVVWRPAGPKQVPEAGELVVSMVVEADGSVSSCEVERADGAAATVARDARCNNAGPFAPPLDDAGKPQRLHIRLVTSVEQQPLP